MSLFVEIFTTSLTPMVFLYMAVGVLAGICIGALPGLTATMGVALLLPMTFGMDAAQGILMLLGIYCGAIYGGSISAVLLHTPGTPASAATAIDGYTLAQKGEAGRALGAATLSSYLGGLVSVACLWLISPLLAKLALKFSSAEFFLLAVFGLCIIGNISGDNIEKGLICGCLGILVACIGIDSVTSYIRFAPEGNFNFMGGINYIPIMIGLFAMSQAFENVEDIFSEEEVQAKLTNILPKKEDLKKIVRIAPLTGLIGTFIGIIPGAGADIGSFVGYNVARSIAKEPELFGKGSVEAISGPEGGNNGVTGGAMIPMLTLGVPGDAVTAIMIGALTIQGLTPGPLVFQESPRTVYNVYAGLILCNLVLVVIVLLTWKLFTKVCSLETTIVFPAVVMFCVIGVYALNSNLTDVWIMLIFAVIGYVLSKFKFPAVCVLIGFILSPLFEKNFRRALVLSKGSFATFFSSPLCIAFWAATIIAVVVIVRGKHKDKALADGM